MNSLASHSLSQNHFLPKHQIRVLLDFVLVYHVTMSSGSQLRTGSLCSQQLQNRPENWHWQIQRVMGFHLWVSWLFPSIVANYKTPEKKHIPWNMGRLEVFFVSFWSSLLFRRHSFIFRCVCKFSMFFSFHPGTILEVATHCSMFLRIYLFRRLSNARREESLAQACQEVASKLNFAMSEKKKSRSRCSAWLNSSQFIFYMEDD